MYSVDIHSKRDFERCVKGAREEANSEGERALRSAARPGAGRIVSYGMGRPIEARRESSIRCFTVRKGPAGGDMLGACL
jgi:hypothetical protein